MAEKITGFWVVDETETSKTYRDYPISPFGPIQLISKETINDLVK